MDLHDDFGFDFGPAVHLHHDDAPSIERLRYIKSADQAVTKWSNNTQAASGQNGSWATNLSNTQKPIVARAIEQKNVMVTNFNRSVTDGKWEAGLNRVGDAGIKAAARAKADNYGTGTAAGSPGATKFENAIRKIIAYEASNLPQIYAMPKGTLAAGKARMNAWADIMAAGAGSFTG